MQLAGGGGQTFGVWGGPPKPLGTPNPNPNLWGLGLGSIENDWKLNIFKNITG